MAEGRNPWLSQPAQPEPVAAETEERATRPTGPTRPQRGVPEPGREDRLPILSQRRGAELWCVGAHGGAGETSFARLVEGWAAAEHGWPQVPDGATAEVVLTARSSMHGLRTAQNAATQWASGLVPDVNLLGLVIVADAPGRLPRPLRDFAKIVAGGVPRMWSVPWIESWRLGDDPQLSEAPHAVRRIVDELRALTRPGAAGTTNRKEPR